MTKATSYNHTSTVSQKHKNAGFSNCSNVPLLINQPVEKMTGARNGIWADKATSLLVVNGVFLEQTKFVHHLCLCLLWMNDA